MIVDTRDLVGVREIADMVGVKTQCVSQWPLRHREFPKPVLELRCGPVYLRQEIQRWLDERKKSH